MPSMPNDAKTVRILTKGEVEKLKADSAKEAAEEKGKIEAFVAQYKTAAALNSNNV